jgi:4-amino-4-deoxy-L-arabinose transferase-like glycosyltransferase
MNDPRKPKGLIRHSWLVVPTLLVASMLSSIPLNNGLSNLYTYEAQAFLHGKLDIEGDISKLPGEIVIHDERLYVAFPPFPAIILLPFVATFGTENIKITLIAAVIGVISCYILYKILNLLELDPFSTLWVLCAFALGTAYWHTLRASEGIWTFAQIVSVCFVLLAIHETLRDGYVPLAGLFLGFAFLSRQLSIYTAIFITAILWENSERQQRLARILVFLFAFGACVLAYILFNYSRFGAIESGYATMIVDEGFGKERLSHYGLFSTAYLTFNSIYMFVQGFHLEFGGADKLQITGLDPYGTSLIAASPFVFAALRARWGQLKLWGGWLSIGLALLHMLLYYNNGFIQLNAQRFTLDFMPVLILLVALGLKNSSDDLSKFIKGLIVYAVVLNALVFILFG